MPATRLRSTFSALAVIATSALCTVTLPALAAASDSIVDVRPPRSAPAVPPADLTVPEPGSLVLVGVGLAGLVIGRRMRSKQRAQRNQRKQRDPYSSQD